MPTSSVPAADGLVLAAFSTAGMSQSCVSLWFSHSAPHMVLLVAPQVAPGTGAVQVFLFHQLCGVVEELFGFGVLMAWEGVRVGFGGLGFGADPGTGTVGPTVRLWSQHGDGSRAVWVHGVSGLGTLGPVMGPVLWLWGQCGAGPRALWAVLGLVTSPRGCGQCWVWGPVLGLVTSPRSCGQCWVWGGQCLGTCPRGCGQYQVWGLVPGLWPGVSPGAVWSGLVRSQVRADSPVACPVVPVSPGSDGAVPGSSGSAGIIAGRRRCHPAVTSLSPRGGAGVPTGGAGSPQAVTGRSRGGAGAPTGGAGPSRGGTGTVAGRCPCPHRQCRVPTGCAQSPQAVPCPPRRGRCPHRRYPCPHRQCRVPPGGGAVPTGSDAAAVPVPPPFPSAARPRVRAVRDRSGPRAGGAGPASREGPGDPGMGTGIREGGLGPGERRLDPGMGLEPRAGPWIPREGPKPGVRAGSRESRAGSREKCSGTGVSEGLRGRGRDTATAGPARADSAAPPSGEKAPRCRSS